MLLDDSEVALNQVLEACAVSADIHEWAAAHAGRESLRQIGERNAHRRHRDAEELVRCMCEAGMLPKQPDPESTGFQAILTGLKGLLSSAFTDEDHEALHCALRDAEAALGQRIAEARATSLAATTDAHLEEMARDVELQRARLENE